MDLEQGNYYHIYNRSNNRELVFKNSENYIYFLKKFRKRFHKLLSIYAYCLMPTHFHFLVKVNKEKIDKLKQLIGIQLSAYTKAVNNMYERNGSLFQQHTKAKLIDDESYLLTLLAYIHQNPVRAGLVDRLPRWPYSSYLDLAGYRNGTLVEHSIIEDNFNSMEDFRSFSQSTIESVDSAYWI